MPSSKIIKDIEQMFDISPHEISNIVRDFHSEMKRGLSGRKGPLKMLPTYVKRPRGTEKGEFLALDLGGTNFRILLVELNGKGKIGKLISKKFVLDKKHIRGSGKAFFDFISGCIKRFMTENGISQYIRHDIGFTFSFPMKKKGINSGVLVRWTKGFRVKDVEGKDVVKLLNKSLDREELANSKVVSINNDTVGTLMAKSYEDNSCDVGVIIGTGTNACYCEKEKVINIEWGNFNKVPANFYDRKLDASSVNPGEQILEKMVSGMYLGELAKLVAKDLIVERLPKVFNTEKMSAIEAKRSRKLSRKNMLLKKICNIISTRAARLSAAALISVITKVDPSLRRKHTVAIDGSVYEKYPGFSREIKKTIKKIMRGKSHNIKLSLTKDGSGKGAAIIAATCKCRKNLKNFILKNG